MKTEDRTMAVLESALAMIQKKEFEARKACESMYADGINAAWNVLHDAYLAYVQLKTRRNPFFRLLVRWKGKKARRAIGLMV